ncbi:MAG TPA: isocitrate/isopropylmalate dehydrogenase family protein [Methanomassiliicoccales archaeon]|nr:isocitrate/isopropylmalate dehydrogenase family protein [Methanomassiliicoccales archaeon]
MFKVAVVPGDGIGGEVIAEGLKVLRVMEENDNLKIEFTEMDIGATRYLKTGELLTAEDMVTLREQDAIYFGAIGDPRVTPGVLERGVLLAMRTQFDQFINHRPVKSWHPFTPLKSGVDFDIDFLRENTEDVYMGAGGTFTPESKSDSIHIERGLYTLDIAMEASYEGDNDFAFEVGLLSRKGVERFADFVMDFSVKRGEKKVTAVDKANVCRQMYGLWREVFAQRADEHDIDVEFMFVDAMAMALVRRPQDFGVVATPNMFGDILTDLGAEVQGGIGLAASGNITPFGVSMFEPVHGSAPDIAGQGKANPFGALLAAKMMLDHMDHKELGSRIEEGIRHCIDAGILTPDLGGKASTSQVGDAVVDFMLMT